MDERFNPSEYLSRSFEEAGITLHSEQTEAFLRYEALLRQKNAVMNLTAITDYEEVVHKHFLDSVLPSLFPEFPAEKQRLRLIDVGSGAGFPGIPLKILRPELEIVLLDSLQKRVGFLEEVIQALGLKNITAIHARAEDGARDPELREGFDLAVSRAVAQLSVLSEYCLPFVKPGGCFLAYKGGDAEAETAAAEAAVRILGGKKPYITPYLLPAGGGESLKRSLIYVEKCGVTPKKYPRKAGTAARAPLG